MYLKRPEVVALNHMGGVMQKCPGTLPYQKKDGLCLTRPSFFWYDMNWKPNGPFHAIPSVSYLDQLYA